MKSIVFVTPAYNPRDIQRGSGTFYYLAQELKRQGCNLHFVGPLVVKDPLPTRFFRWITRSVFNKRYLTYLDPWVARTRCKALAKEIATVDCDFILTNDHGIAAENVTGKPVVVYTDVMLPLVYKANSIKPFTPLYNIPFLVIKIFQHTIKRSLEHAALCVFPAEWQKVDALQYGVSSNKLALIPFGANIPDPGCEVAENRNFHLQNKRLDLLFVGKDWQRKGGDMAVKITSLLQESGINAFLHVVGADIKDLPPYIKIYGLLDKNKEKEWGVLNKLYTDCHIFLFPSLSEGSAIVPREAAAYGLPTLSYRIDGLTGAVEDGINGILFDLSANEHAFVAVIKRWIQNPGKYNQLIKSSRQFYETDANWQFTVRTLLRKTTAMTHNMQEEK